MRKLCYSISEANCVFLNDIARMVSACSNYRNILLYSGFNIWWRNITKKKLSANLYGYREICFARVFSFEFLNDYMRGNQFREVVHDKAGINFLCNILHLFCVKMEQANGIFQFSKRSFNPPAHPIKKTKFFRRKFFCVQMQKAVGSLSIYSLKITIRMFRISRDLNIGTISSKQSIPFVKFVGIGVLYKKRKQSRKCKLINFPPLLDKSRPRW